MPSFDVNTIIVCASAFPIAFGLSLITFSREQPCRMHWLLAAVLFGVAGELIGFRALLPEWSYTVFANLLIGASIVLIHRGTLVLLGRRPPDWLYAMALALLGALYVWFTFIAPNIPWRLFTISMFRIPFFLGTAAVIYPLMRRRQPASAVLLFWVMLATSAWFLYRAGLSLSSEAMAAQVRVGWLQGVNFMVGTICHLLVIAILFRMELETAVANSDRLAAELNAHRDKLEDLVDQRTKALNEAMVEAQAADRAKSFFLAAMSHEIRTPMSGIMGMAELLADDPRLAPDQRERVETVHLSAVALLTILNDILDLSKLDAGKLRLDPEPVDLRQLVSVAVALIRPGADDKKLRLDVRLDDALPRQVLADPTRLRQIVMNLLSNAVKFTETGEIVVSLTQVERSGEPRLELTVVDTGIGISEQDQALLFNNFVQVGAISGGTGLGLAICRRLVDLMGGSISLKSALGQGSAFTVELPLVIAPTVASEPELDERPLPALRILVVDDDETNQVVLTAMLSRAGHHVRVASDGASAVAASQEDTFDLILMDSRMPGMDGLEATRRIRALPGTAGRVPIIGISANAFKDDVQSCLEAGMNAHISKPVASAKLRATLAAFCGGRDKVQ